VAARTQEILSERTVDRLYFSLYLLALALTSLPLLLILAEGIPTLMSISIFQADMRAGMWPAVVWSGMLGAGASTGVICLLAIPSYYLGSLTVARRSALLVLIFIPLLMPGFLQAFAFHLMLADAGATLRFGVYLLTVFGYILPFAGAALVLDGMTVTSLHHLVERDLGTSNRRRWIELILPRQWFPWTAAFLVGMLVAISELDRATYLSHEQTLAAYSLGRLKAGYSTGAVAINTLLFLVGIAGFGRVVFRAAQANGGVENS
jgi:ABC-type spermidine/putrescine transport system permease subunit II